MSDQGDQVTIVLVDVEGHDAIPDRRIVLRAPRWEVKIGRGTMGIDDAFRPATDNAWFDSRVMSRNHAKLTVDPSTKVVSIEDVGSLHGTHFDSNRRLRKGEPEAIYSGDVFTFGADVIRGSARYHALKLRINLSWSDIQDPISPAFADDACNNTFSADFSEDEANSADDYDSVPFGGDMLQSGDDIMDNEDGDGDDDIQIIHESIRPSSVEIVPPPRTFTVPESDFSDEESVHSDYPCPESPASSPLVTSEHEKKSTHSDDIQPLPEAIQAKVPEIHLDHEEDFDAAFDAAKLPYEHHQPPKSDFSKNLTPSSTAQVLLSDGHEVPLTSAWTSSTPTGYQPQQGQRNEIRRTPSPSDAAMARTTTTDSNLPVTKLWSSASLSINQDEEEPPTSRFQPDPVSSSSVWSSENNTTGPAMVPFAATYTPPFYDPLTYSTVSETTVPHQGLPSRVSIDSILDTPTDNGQSQLHTAVGKGTKRKADQMSCAGTQWPLAVSDEWMKMAMGQAEVLQNPHSEIATASQWPESDTAQLVIQPAPELLVDTTRIIGPASINSSKSARPTVEGTAETAIGSTAPTDAEPSRKRAKKEHKSTKRHSNSGGSFTKYAITAFTGVALGAVGAVCGLAFLG